jgi:predicted P-loop ATPase
MSKVVPFSSAPEAGARDPRVADDERQRNLFEWATRVLTETGVAAAIAKAATILALRNLAFDAETPAIVLAIRDALHPATGSRQDHFTGLREGSLKRILQNRFDDLKRDREKELGSGHSGHRDWTVDLILKKDGNIAPILANLVLMLRNAPNWRDVLAFDEFSVQVVINKQPPWGREEPDTPWTDHHDAMARIWFQQNEVNAGMGDVGRAVQTAAKHNMFHPVRARFEAQQWDGVPRADTWLIRYFGAEDTPYIRAVGPRWLISGAARIYDPGCKADYVLVLEGPQGKQKSEALRVLALRDAWFTDRLSHLASKDAALEITGVLIVEIGEMEALARASSSTAKSFLSRRRDRFRPPYGKRLVSLPRQCICAGTINPPAQGYLRDATGARRLWPVACQGMIKRAELEQVRDQLWAEAVHYYKTGAPWWLETPELEALATAEQEARYIIDEWFGIVADWIGKRADVSIPEVLEHALGFSQQQWTEAAQKRVGRILTKLGFSKWRATGEGKKRGWRYRRAPQGGDNPNA